MEIDCVTSGEAAIESVRRGHIRYNAIFMDHMMPGMDGMEATGIIRKLESEYARTVPIIALTANAIVGNKELFLKNGFQDFVSKPIEIAYLDSVIKQWVRNKEQEKIYEGRLIGVDGEAVFDLRKKDRRSGLDRRKGNDRRELLALELKKTEAPSKLESIPGLDMAWGLARFGGDLKLYRSILKSFVANTRKLLDKIGTVSESGLADYCITVHGIKGSSRGVGAALLGDEAEALEKAAKAGELAYVTEKNTAFLASAGQLLDSIETFLEADRAGESRLVKDRPDAAVLAQLCEACASYDIDAIDSALGELEACDYASSENLVVWLRENVDCMNYDDIVKKLGG
jgi:CheY-like chemotaxis protein